MKTSTEELRIAELEARVVALEEMLEERSRRLRALQQKLCRKDLFVLNRIESGGAVAPILGLENWQETTELTRAEVEETLEALWASTRPSMVVREDGEDSIP